MSQLTLNHEAYCLLFMHVCKYPFKVVNGLLLGTVQDGAVRVCKALPMFHSTLSLSPMLETALMLVRMAPLSTALPHELPRRPRANRSPVTRWCP